MKKILILGVNGFIGHHLSQRIMNTTDWEVYGMDMNSERVTDLMDNPRFHFFEGDITINKEWIEYHVKKCDVILPLVAIATPATYVKEPLRVFELDFEANLPIVRQAVKYKKRVIFPSTSEVYGMSQDPEFDPENSPLIYGPINKPRWIYACAKQMMDRVIHAYGQQEGLQYTLFRPFNWIGPGLDSIHTPKEGSSRVITQFLGHIVRGEPIKLVDGGAQKRSFTYVTDGIDALMKIIENKDGIANGKIYNIGNPGNNYSIRELATLMLDLARQYPEYAESVAKVKVLETTSAEYYGKGYQDTSTACPRSPTPWPTSTGRPRWLRGRLARHLRSLPRRRRGSTQADGLSCMPKLALKIDVDTWRGTLQGVPRLVEILRRHRAGASFPVLARTGSHRARHQARVPPRLHEEGATHLGGLPLWIKTLMYGTLLPGPDIGRRGADILRATAMPASRPPSIAGITSSGRTAWPRRHGLDRDGDARAHQRYRRDLRHRIRSRPWRRRLADECPRLAHDPAPRISLGIGLPWQPSVYSRCGMPRSSTARNCRPRSRPWMN
jgi:nucleoside-diphosphate-sugar epimerase